jgi:alpha-L-fucosidase 2
VNDNLLSLITDYRGQGLTIGWFGNKKIFQIEAGLGTSAAIAEMLLQSQGRTIRTLPALPEQWPAGSVSGLVGQGGFVIVIEWQGGREEHVRIHSRLGNRCRMKFHFPPAKIALKANGRLVAFKRLAGNVIEFPTIAGADYELRLH